MLLPLPLLLPAALAAEPPTQVQAHALAAGSALVHQPGDPGETPMAGVILDSARLQGVMRHDLDTGEHLGVMVQLEAANGPALLDAVATYAPNDAVAVDVGLQRTALSEMYDIILPNMPLRVRTAPEGIAPARRTGPSRRRSRLVDDRRRARPRAVRRRSPAGPERGHAPHARLLIRPASPPTAAPRWPPPGRRP